MQTLKCGRQVLFQTSKPSLMTVQSSTWVHLALLAKSAGLATGVVTTTRITHATPAATYAHTSERNWESDGEMPAAAKAQGCLDIAQQLLQYATKTGIDVVMGGGLNKFLPPGSYPAYNKAKGSRTDNRNLIAEWQAAQAHTAFVHTGSALAALDLGKTGKLVGLFNGDHLSYEYDRKAQGADEPSLAAWHRRHPGCDASAFGPRPRYS